MTPWQRASESCQSLSVRYLGSVHTRAIAYAACAGASNIFRSQTAAYLTNYQSLLNSEEPRAASGAHAMQATTHYQTYPERPARSAPEKSVQFGPDGNSRAKASITRGPPGTA